MRRPLIQFMAASALRVFQRGVATVASGVSRGNGYRRLLGAFTFAAAASFAQANDVQEVADENTGNLPAFLFEPLHASNQGSVHGIYEARQADLVLVEGGFDSGFQPGMVCRVSGSEGEIGEIMLVDVRNNASAALILQLEPGNVIEPGHSVRIKTVTF